MYLAQKYYLRTLFLCLLLETGPPFYVVIQASQRFSVIFKTLSVGPVPGIEPLTSRSAVRCSSDWADPAQLKWSKYFLNLLTFLSFKTL